MPSYKNIAQLRKEIRRLENEVSNLAIFAPSVKEGEAYEILAIELHDLDWALYNAIFIKNNSKLSTLINGLKAETEDAAKTRSQIRELTQAFQKATQVVKQANNFSGKAKETLNELRGLLKEIS